MGTERILPKPRSRKDINKFDTDTIGNTTITTTDNESVCVDFPSITKKPSTIFAQVSPIYERQYSCSNEEDASTPRNNNKINSKNNSMILSSNNSSSNQISYNQSNDDGQLQSELILDFVRAYDIEVMKQRRDSVSTDELSEMSSVHEQQEPEQEEYSIPLSAPYFMPSVAASSFTMSHDEMNLRMLIQFFTKELQLTEQVALQYGNILVKNGIPKIEILKRRLLRDSELLLNLGFDEYISEDIIEHLITPEDRKNAGPTSPKNANNGGRSQALQKFKFDTLPSEIAHLYHRATQQSDSSACDKLQELSFNGNKFAQGFLMRMYALGQGKMEKSVEQARILGAELMPWLKELVGIAELSSSAIYGMYAKYLLGVCYSEGLGVEKNHREAVYWHRQSAELGYEAAQAYLGHCYYTGQGVVRDPQQAAKWYHMSANQGYAAAQCNLGICYELGEGVEKNLEEAVKWFILASSQNDSKAQYNLARCHEKGLGVQHDLDKAIYYYKLAADQSHPAAQYSMGLFYFSGNDSVEQNMEEAIYWFSRSAALGYAPAQCKLALCYEKGVGVQQDLQQAVYYYGLSAEQGEASALYYLGYCYANGLGIDKNESEGIKLYLQSAEKGYAAAQNNLGYCYFSGMGVPKNYTQALFWYRKSAEQGYPPAQYNMGFCYEKGFGVPKKTSEMLRWYRLAASQGQKKATAALERLQA